MVVEAAPPAPFVIAKAEFLLEFLVVALAAAGSGRGRPPKLLRRDGEHHPVSVNTLAHALPAEAWHNIAWREGSADWLHRHNPFERSCRRPQYVQPPAPSRLPVDAS